MKKPHVLPKIEFKIKKIIYAGGEGGNKIVEAILVIELENSHQKLWTETDYFAEQIPRITNYKIFEGKRAVAELDFLEGSNAKEGDAKKYAKNTEGRELYYKINGEIKKIVACKPFVYENKVIEPKVDDATIDCGLDMGILIGIPKTKKFRVGDFVAAEGWFRLRHLHFLEGL